MRVTIISDGPDGAKNLTPALELLGYSVATAALSTAVLGERSVTTEPDLLLVDATTDVGTASAVCRGLASSEAAAPVIVVVSEGALAVLKASWGFEDWLLPTAQPAEIETRIRVVLERSRETRPRRPSSIGDLSIDEDTYVVRLRGRPLNLTYREFELLNYLAHNPGRVFTRGQLLQEVWGYDYFGGTRTVDVHIRRLRAKLGAEYEQLIATVRGVGYKLDPQGAQAPRDPDPDHGDPDEG